MQGVFLAPYMQIYVKHYLLQDCDTIVANAKTKYLS